MVPAAGGVRLALARGYRPAFYPLAINATPPIGEGLADPAAGCMEAKATRRQNCPPVVEC